MNSFKHIEYMLCRKSFPDFLKAVNMKVDLKEWTECIGMFHQISWLTKNKEIDFAFDIGCGKRPTLGVLLSLNLKSIEKVICVDPQLDTSLAKNIRDIYLFPSTLESFLEKIKVEKPFKNAIICCNHSHVSKKEVYNLIDLCENWIYITTPCCIDNKFDRGYYFKDKHMWTPKNEIYIFSSGDINAHMDG